jgi:hypothetical protein
VPDQELCGLLHSRSRDPLHHRPGLLGTGLHHSSVRTATASSCHLRRNIAPSVSGLTKGPAAAASAPSCSARSQSPVTTRARNTLGTHARTASTFPPARPTATVRPTQTLTRSHRRLASPATAASIRWRASSAATPPSSTSVLRPTLGKQPMLRGPMQSSMACDPSLCWTKAPPTQPRPRHRQQVTLRCAPVEHCLLVARVKGPALAHLVRMAHRSDLQIASRSS